MLVNKNLKFLRTRQGMTQKQLAEKLGLKQSVIGAYEEERATPPLPCLLDISKIFKVSLDTLAQQDLSHVSEKEWKAQQFVRGKEVLAITVDKDNKENVELVTQKASAGYLSGYQDPEFVKELPKISLPVLGRNKTYRAFEIQGDSMLPIQPGTMVFGEYVSDISSVKSNNVHIVVTKQEGIVFKRVFNFLKEEQKLLLVSDNPHYAPFSVHADDVLEIWKGAGFFSIQFPEASVNSSINLDYLALTILKLQNPSKPTLKGRLK